MVNDSKIAGKIKAQITRFANRMSYGWKRPKRKFITQMLFGIQASKDVKLSNIARSLKEDIALIKTETRLSRQIGEEDLTEQINDKLIEEGRHRIKEDTVLALDLGDINKPYAKAMEHIAGVWDGSSGERGKGYWLADVVGADLDGEDVVPLYGELYSQEAEDFKSENNQLFKAIDAVVKGVGTRGIWVIDRGGDRMIVFGGLLNRGLKFVVRLTGKRDLVLKDGARENVAKIASRCPTEQEMEVEIEKDGQRKKRRIALGYREVRFPKSEVNLYLVVIKGFSYKPMMLLTNLELRTIGLRRALEIYLTRWKCEESYRFIKQGYNLEDIRLLSYTGLRNMIALVQAVFYFVSIELGKKLKLNILLKKIYEKAKRFFEIPDFKQYAIADGIYRILFNYKPDIARLTEKRKGHQQLVFPFAIHLL
jgi:hypothetical protein